MSLRTRENLDGKNDAAHDYVRDMTKRTGEYIDQFTTVTDNRTAEEVMSRVPKCVVAHRMKQEQKMDISREGKAGEASEYFCFQCGQLRLSLISDKTKCMRCGSMDIVKGKCGELDKQKLKDDFNEPKDPE